MIDLQSVSRNVANGSGTMNGAESLVRTLVAGGVDVCFAKDGAAAIAAAKGAPPQIATLILPADTAWNEADGIAQVPVESQRAGYSSQAVDNAAKLLRNGGASTL